MLYESQYGFRTEHSTEMASMELIDRLILTMDNNETSLNIIYLDMSKAFDTIDHTILINKLTFYGIHGIALDLIKSYLNNRYQFVEYDGVQLKAPLHDTIRSCGACRLLCMSVNRKVWHVSRLFRANENRMTLNYSAFYFPAD